jgi:hypothetical protein
MPIVSRMTHLIGPEADRPRHRAARVAGVAGVAGVTGVALTVAAWGVWAPVPASGQAPPAPSATETFTYQGAVSQTAVVPADVSMADVRVVGGKGGGSHSGDTYITGGDGAQVSGVIAVTPGEVLTVEVGGVGGDVANNSTDPGEGGWGATGDGGRGGDSDYYLDGGGGGGASSLEIANCEGCASSTVAVAGGGGGGGGRGLFSGPYDGGPGGSSGATVDPGHNGKGPGAGKGGQGGANGVPSGGSGGGSGYALGGGGGGGGAGILGGTGGGGGVSGGGGGGGGGAGSSQVSSRLTDPSVVRGSTSDGNGLVVVAWANSALSCLDQTVQVPRDSPGVRVQLHCSEFSRPASFRIGVIPEHGHLDHRDLIKGTFTYVPLPGYGGPDSMTFQGLAGDLTSAPATVTFAIDQTVPPVTLTASSTHVVVGEAPVLTVTLPTDATGNVAFYDSDQPGTDKGIGNAPIANGVATLATPTQTLGVGTHAIYAAYNGDTKYTPNSSNVVNVTVSRAVPPMTLAVSSTDVVVGEAPVLTVTMPTDATGEVGFYDRDQSGAHHGIGIAAIVDGIATLATPTKPLGVGVHPIHASYGGDASYTANDSNVVDVTVSRAVPPMVLTASSTDIVVGEAPVLTVTMPAAATGDVRFYDSVLGDIGTAPVVDGIATLTPTKSLDVGTHLIYASYDGDANYLPNGSNVVVIAVRAP